MSVALAAVACSSSGDDEPAAGTFTYHATASWYVGTTPQVTSVTIDGQSVASGETYEVMQEFHSFDEAVTEFVPRVVVVTIATGPKTFMIAPGFCNNLLPEAAGETFTAERDMYYPQPSATGGPGIGFYPYCGECDSKTATHGWCD
jgi:hypothetical protein